MIETRIVPPNVTVKHPEIDNPYVLVQKFDEEAMTKFISDCQRVLAQGQDFLPIVIDSYGGQCYTLLGMVDFLSTVDAEIVTICNSKAMSCGAVLFACGHKRYTGPSATFMVHEVASCFWGKDVDFTNDAKEVSRLNRKFMDILDKSTGQAKGYWKKLVNDNLRADLYLTSTMAKKHQLATDIAVPRIETEIKIERRLIV